MDKKKTVSWIKRSLVYVVGMMIIAFAVNVSIRSNLGVSPVNSIPYVLSQQWTFLTMGNWVSIIFSLFVLVQIPLLRKDFKWYYVFQFVVSIVFGWFVDWTAIWVNAIFPTVDHILLRLLYVAVSIVLIAIGIMLYLEPDIMSMPGEGVTMALTKVLKKPLSSCKLYFDVTITGIAIILSFLFFGKLVGIHVGTIAIAFGVGIVLKPIMKICKKPLRQWLFETEEKKREKQ